MILSRFAIFAILLTTVLTARAQAATTKFTDRATWTATAGLVASTGFSGAVGTTEFQYLSGPATYGGFTFTPAGNDVWIVGPDYTTIPAGMYDWLSGPIMAMSPANTELLISFPEPVLAFGFDFGIFSNGPGSVSYGGILDLILPDGTTLAGSSAKTKALAFLGVVSTVPFSSVVLKGGPVTVLDNFSRSVPAPDASVPEPGSFALIGLALLGGWTVRLQLWRKPHGRAGLGYSPKSAPGVF